MAVRFPKKRIGISGAASVTTQKVEKYIDEFLDQISDFMNIQEEGFDVQEIAIAPVVPPVNKDQRFEKCFGSNESKHHGYLKWFSYNYIRENAADLMDLEIKYETNVFMPNSRYWEHTNLNVYGRLLRKEELTSGGGSGMHGPQAWFQEADVSCQGAFIIECGDTSPMSLVLPIITQAVSKIIWIPHKAKGAERKKEWDDFETPLKAFVINRAH